MVLAKAVTVEYCRLCGAPVKDVQIYTRRQVEKHGLVRLTQWCQPGERIPRSYVWPTPANDPILAGDWLKEEAARVLRDPTRRAALVVNTNTGEQAIYVNRVAGSARDDEDDDEG